MPAIIVPRQTACEPSDAVPVRIWAADTLGADEGGEVARWLSDFLDTPCRLLREHPKAHRVASPDHVDSWIAKHNDWADGCPPEHQFRSEEHTSELQSLMSKSDAVFCWKKKQ